MVPHAALRASRQAAPGSERIEGSVVMEASVLLLAVLALISAALLVFAAASFLGSDPARFRPPRPVWALPAGVLAAAATVASIWLLDRRWNQPGQATAAALTIYALSFAGLFSAIDELCMTCIGPALLSLPGTSMYRPPSVSAEAFVALAAFAALSLYLVVGVWTKRPWAWWTSLLFTTVHPLGLSALLLPGIPGWILLAVTYRGFFGHHEPSGSRPSSIAR